VSFEPTAHPVLRIPTANEALTMGSVKWMDLMRQREELIVREKHDPLRFGYEPPVWKICDALVEWPWIDKAWACEVRERVQYKNRIRILMINGANRGSKSEYAGKRTQMLLNYRDAARAWVFHSTHQMSIDYHQTLMWRYMPPENRRQVKTAREYISYSQKNGFSDDKFVLPNAAECTFRNYEQDVSTIEGGDLDIIWADERLRATWVNILKSRVATRDGWIIITFTPIDGYTRCVGMFHDGAVPVIEEPAFLLPKDGKEPLPDLAFGIDGRGYVCPHDPLGQPLPVPTGRRFERVPRVLKTQDDSRAVVFFHSSDNPYSNPHSLYALHKSDPPAKLKERLYGVASKIIGVAFPKFNRKVHVVPAASIPKQGTNYFLCDPASGRNFVFKWYRVLPEAAYLYREWPGGYEIPEVGVPGPWAVPSDTKHDGDRGPAQNAFGWGLERYKREIARLERWKDWAADQEAIRAHGTRQPVAEWDERSGAEEEIAGRFIDSRAASAPKVENDEPTTLLTDFEALNLFFDLTPGDDLREGIAKITTALDYEMDEAISFFNKPKFFVSDECTNSIYALENWTGADGERGACKDFIDLDRYFTLLALEYMAPKNFATRGGGHY